MRTVAFGLALIVAGVVVASVVPACAQQYLEYPVPTPGYPFQRSVLTGRAVIIPPYDRPFPVRAYTTPPKPPYYNVPPYAVVVPY